VIWFGAMGGIMLLFRASHDDFPSSGSQALRSAGDPGLARATRDPQRIYSPYQLLERTANPMG